MQATLTELQRKGGRVAEAIARRETVVVTRHGETIAEIEPRSRGLTGAEFARRWKNRKRMDAATCDEAIKALRALDQAG